MSSTAIHTPATDVLTWLDRANSSLAHVPLAIPADQAVRVVKAAERIMRRAEAIKLAAIAAKAAVTPAQVMTSWLAKTTNSDAGRAAGQVRLAAAIPAASKTQAGLAAGDYSSNHARIISDTMEHLPAELSAGERDQVEAGLVQRARWVAPGRVRREARRALEHANRAAVEVERHADAVARSEEDRAWARARVAFKDNADGTMWLSATLPTAHGLLLKKLLQSMTAPRVRSMKEARAATCATQSGGVFDVLRDTSDRETDWAHEWGMAFCQLIEHAPTDHLSGKVNATLVVTMELDALRGGLKAATLDMGETMSAGEARRLACGAGLVPAVLNGESLPLDLGRMSRLFTDSQRLALAGLYETCSAEDCDRPFAWSEMHHHDPWKLGGETNLELAVPLCGYHHREVHKPANDVQYVKRGAVWSVRILPRT